MISDASQDPAAEGIDLQEPTTGEIDCLAVIWRAAEQGKPALKLSEIHALVGERRRQFGELPPALTTVSTYLRVALAKRLVVEVRLSDSGQVVPMTGVRTRGALPAARSPRTAYQAAYPPGQVFRRTFEGIVHAYPPGQRPQALLDLALALELSPERIKELTGFVNKDRISPKQA